MGQDMSMVLGGRLLPKPSTFKKTDSINGVDVTTLGGAVCGAVRVGFDIWFGFVFVA